MIMKLSAVVITQNEEKNVERCLRSLRFADEIVVVDALSEDRTVEIAKRLGARVVSQEWAGFAAQKQFAIEQAAGDWILLVDADEEVSTALADEIRGATRGQSQEAGFKLQRKSQFLGAWMSHGPWAEDYQTRLFKRARGRIAQRPVHEGVLLDGNSMRLRNPLFHYTHQTLSESVQRLNRYTTLEAAERVQRRRITLADAVIPPAAVFARYYLVKGCWKAGSRGFLLSMVTALYKSVLYLKIYFLQRSRPSRAVDSV
jgi:glycosyltransferase involved in cell wall biosynthesis